MAITNNYNIIVQNGKSSLDKDVYLTAGDKNLMLKFKIKGLDYDISGCNTCEINLLSQAGKVVNATATISASIITMTVSPTMIDELTEVGTYALEIKISDADSTLTLPLISNQFHVRPSLSMGGDTINVGTSSVNKGHVGLGDTESGIFNADKSYKANTWNNGDVIEAGKLNKVESALSYLMDVDVIYITPVSNTVTLKVERKQASKLTDNGIIILPDMTGCAYANMFLLLDCTKEIKVTFRSTGDNTETITMPKGYHVINMIYYEDWIITC